METATVGISHIQDRHVIWANGAHDEIFGYPPGGSRGLSLTAFYVSEADYQQAGQAVYPALARGETYSAELEMRRADGGRFWCVMTGRAIEPADLSRGSIWCLQDITERKQVELRLRALLAEKDVLVKEIHHRVKNNLQVVVSLLGLQADRIQDPAAQAVFQDSQERVRSIALVHEKLYQSQDLARIDFPEYLRELTQSLQQIFAAGRMAWVTVETDPVWLGVDLAIPCGLIVNELVTNALKYAYPDGRVGQVLVRFAAEAGPESAARQFHLTVSDNGVGLPPGLNPAKTRSLGLKLVQILTRQIGGTLTITNSSGAKFALAFGERKGQRP